MTAPLPFTWPYALAFWGVFAWAYAPEFRIIQKAKKQQTAADAKSLQVIINGGGIASALAFFLAWWPPMRMAASLQLPSYVLGTVLVIGGSLLRRHCWKMLDKSFTGDVRATADQEVVTRGAYKYIRHPSYLAGTILNTGVGIALGSWLPAGLMLIQSLAFYHYRMNVEERVLLHTIGEPYRKFMVNRKRLIPGVY